VLEAAGATARRGHRSSSNLAQSRGQARWRSSDRFPRLIVKPVVAETRTIATAGWLRRDASPSHCSVPMNGGLGIAWAGSSEARVRVCRWMGPRIPYPLLLVLRVKHGRLLLPLDHWLRTRI
jgi:hypothetical protein